jgi:hypothetical protein
MMTAGDGDGVRPSALWGRQGRPSRSRFVSAFFAGFGSLIVPAAISLDHRADRFGGIRPIARSRKSQTELKRHNMKRPTDDQILTALCCGPKCTPNTGYCHRWDFTTELTRVRALLDNMLTDLEAKLERFEILATECEMIGKLALDRAKRELYSRLALHYRELIDDMRKTIASKDAALPVSPAL